MVRVFDDKKFFLVQRLPSRVQFIRDIELNGGRVVKLESQADYVIADHIRKDAPPGSLSYKFVEAAIAIGETPKNIEQYRAGAVVGSTRPVGSRVVSTKGTRTPFTAEDDRILLEYVNSHSHARLGNEIYKEFERMHPHHTFQSWRDRWNKKLQYLSAPAGAENENQIPTPPLDGPAPAPPVRPALATGTQTVARATSVGLPAMSTTAAQAHDMSILNKEGYPGSFTKADFENLMQIGEDISNIPYGNWQAAWAAWAEKNPPHSAEDWRKFYEQIVGPEYKRRVDAGEIKTTNDDEQEEEDEDSAPVAEKTTKIETAAGSKKDVSPVPKFRLPRSTQQAQDASPKRKQRSATPESRQIKRRQVVPEKEVEAEPALPQPSEDEQADADSEAASEQEHDEHPVQLERMTTSDADHLARMQLLEEQNQHTPRLTTENLAQVNQASKARLSRAADLPVDDEDHDQTEFAEFLGGILKSSPERWKMLKGKAEVDDASSSYDEDSVGPARGAVATGSNAEQIETEDLPDDSSQMDEADVTIRAVFDDAGDAGRPLTYPVTEVPVSSPLPRRQPQFRMPFQVESSSPVRQEQSEYGLGDETPGRVDFGDLSVLEPEGGWANTLSSDAPESPPRSIDERFRTGLARGNTFETQALLDADTIQPDFDFFAPDLDSPYQPDDDWYEDEPREVPEHPEEAEEEDISVWFDAQIAKGFSAIVVQQALKGSSLKMDMAEDALEFFADQKSFPTVWAGFWTEEHDRIIEGNDGNKIKSLEKLHGKKEFNNRLPFLMTLRSG